MSEEIARAEPPYLRIAAEIRRRITEGELRAGQKVPSTRQIISQWGVAMATATKVISTLRQEGWVQAKPGMGTVVSSPTRKSPPRPLPSPPKGGERDLTQARIVRAAMAIADREGLSGLSIRRIASELEAAPMSLYRYFPSKDQLVLAMIDSAFGEVQFPDPRPPGWRKQLETCARLQWALARRHPWLAPALSFNRPQAAPRGMAHTEWSMRALDGLGLDPGTMLYVAVALFGYVRGLAMDFELTAQSEQETGLTDKQWMETHEPEMLSILSSGAFPMMARLAQQTDFDMDLDQLFEFGLQRLLDGLAVFLSRRGLSKRSD